MNSLLGKKINLKCDLAGEFPIYIYWDKNSNLLLYSKSIVKLLEDQRIHKPLKINFKSLSFLLQSSVVPPPHSIYENIYILNMEMKQSYIPMRIKLMLNSLTNFPLSILVMQKRRLQNQMKISY